MNWMYLNMFCIIHIISGKFDTSQNFHKNLKFLKPEICGMQFSIFKGVPKSNYIVVRVFPGVRKGHIFFPVISCTILLRFYLYPQVFLKKSLFRIFHYMTIFRRSSSGWVLMVLKVIPSKSSKSGEHFKYLQRTHIFHSSWDFLHFLPKTPPSSLLYSDASHMDSTKSAENPFFCFKVSASVRLAITSSP